MQAKKQPPNAIVGGWDLTRLENTIEVFLKDDIVHLVNRISFVISIAILFFNEEKRDRR